MKFSFFNLTHHSHYTPPPLLPVTIIKPTRRKSPPRWVRMDSSSPSPPKQQKDKIVVIMGATGCGKTRLSIDLATRFQSEIINTDKMQVYKGLDITTNKITLQDRLGVPHHLLGEVDPDNCEFSPSDFRLHAGLSISDIVSRQKLPLLVGGSNSYIHALLVDRFNPEINVFQQSKNSESVSTQLRYDCCFIWVDVSLPLLCDYLCKRVDEMLDSGMFEELSEYYASVNPESQPGLRKAIGVPEFDRYFKKYPPGYQGGKWDFVQRGVYEEAVRMIKENTCQLAKRQMGKILRLKSAGWDLHRKKRKKKKKWMEIWERDVLKPSMKIVNHFLDE
ncbi:adenylate dimethylallyltransferase, putative [Ricinus communis]|uniref:adenylate dimethylallyltransferase (ADP/ATP-dependent) n=1 Tax=Ricinus communis TaxID=3988 RepID=B9SLW3_RICCO|nr:adenylate dimethylallyltransferase, putative [Ricinus communis]